MNYLFLLILNAVFFGSCNDYETKIIDYVSIDSTMVSNRVGIGSSETDLRIVFGKPDSVVKYFDPIIDEIPSYYYYYGKTYFVLISNKVESFKITDNRFELLDLHVGDSVKKLAEKYPASYSEKFKTDKNSNFFLVMIGIITNLGVKSDNFFIIFKINSEQILSIEYWENP